MRVVSDYNAQQARKKNMSHIRTYATHANAKRALAQLVKRNNKAQIFKHNRQDKRYKQQIVYAVYVA